jgi:hypothetical protein
MPSPPETPIAVPVLFSGRRDESVRFSGIAVGLSEDGFGCRTNDQRLGLAAVEGLLRQPFRVLFDIPGLHHDEILIRLLRIEAARKDPSHLYFIAAEFMQLSDVDMLSLQTALPLFSKKRTAGPVIGPPPPPPGAGKL